MDDLPTNGVSLGQSIHIHQVIKQAANGQRKRRLGKDWQLHEEWGLSPNFNRRAAMHKWIVELWRDGERIRTMEFMDEKVQYRSDGIIVITFPVREMGGGLHIASHDELHISEIDDVES